MTNYDRIYAFAAGAYGLVSSREAHELGVSDKELSRLAASGRLERLGYGVYRIEHHVVGPRDQYAVAVKLAGAGARLYGPSVLALLDLAPTDPRRVHVAVDRRLRKSLPAWMRIHRVPGGNVACYEGIASQAIEEAISSSRFEVMGDRLLDAADEARRRGLLRRDEYEKLREELCYG